VWFFSKEFHYEQEFPWFTPFVVGFCRYLDGWFQVKEGRVHLFSLLCKSFLIGVHFCVKESIFVELLGTGIFKDEPYWGVSSSPSILAFFVLRFISPIFLCGSGVHTTWSGLRFEKAINKEWFSSSSTLARYIIKKNFTHPMKYKIYIQILMILTFINKYSNSNTFLIF